MEMKLKVLALCCFGFCSCQNLDRKEKTTPDQPSMFLLSKPFTELSQESKAVLAVKDYLLSKGHKLDSLYVYEISYSDSLCTIPNDSSIIPNPIKACFAIFNIEHRINHVYYLRISHENAQIIEENQGKNENDWQPLVIPSRPEFLKKEILLHYYFQQDSLVDVLSPLGHKEFRAFER